MIELDYFRNNGKKKNLKLHFWELSNELTELHISLSLSLYIYIYIYIYIYRERERGAGILY